MPTIICKIEQAKQLAALKQWLVSQDIPESHWTPLFAVLAAEHINKLASGNIMAIFALLETVTSILVEETRRCFNGKPN